MFRNTTLLKGLALASLLTLLAFACRFFSPASSPTPTLQEPTLTSPPPPIPTLAPPTRTLSSIDAWTACVPLQSGVPLPPVSYAEYPQAILDYLNQGGRPEELAPLLQAQGVASPPYFLAAVDTTGGGMIDVAVSLVNPGDPAFQPPPGDLLVYMCQDGRYIQAYQRYSGEIGGSAQIHEALDLNADGAAELVVGFPSCGAHTCFEVLEVLAWNGATFDNRLAGDSSDLPYPQVAVSDSDGDGSYDLSVTGTGYGSVGAGPPRSVTRLWAYNPSGRTWEPAGEFPGAAQYRVHVVHDADAYARQGDYEGALSLYQQVIDDPALLEWDIHDPADLAAYARFKLVLLHLVMGQPEGADAHYQELVGQFPPDSPQYVFVELSVLFRNGFLAGGAGAGCQEVRTYITQFPDRVLPFFDYGYGNPAYTAEDVCPW